MTTAPTTFDDASRPQVALDDATVRRFMEAFAALRPLIERLGGGADPTSDLDQALRRDDRARAEVAALLARHGYATFEAWSDAVFSVTVALAFADPETGIERMERELRRALAEIEADADMPAEEKSEAVAAMRGELETMLRMRPSAGNLAAIRPHAARLRALLGQ